MPVYNHSGGKYVYMESLIHCSDILHLHLITEGLCMYLIGFYVSRNRISHAERKLTRYFIFGAFVFRS